MSSGFQRSLITARVRRSCLSEHKSTCVTTRNK